jgi:hypothetical protein
MGNAPQPQLYDRNTDPGERQNVAQMHPDIVKKMQAELDQIRSSGRSRP